MEVVASEINKLFAIFYLLLSRFNWALLFSEEKQILKNVFSFFSSGFVFDWHEKIILLLASIKAFSYDRTSNLSVLTKALARPEHMLELLISWSNLVSCNINKCWKVPRCYNFKMASMFVSFPCMNSMQELRSSAFQSFCSWPYQRCFPWVPRVKLILLQIFENLTHFFSIRINFICWSFSLGTF